MARIRLASPYDAYHGVVAGQTGAIAQVLYNSAKAGDVARRYVVPANPDSTLQVLFRGYMTAASASYSALTAAQAAIWDATAIQINRTNIVNVEYELSGIDLFVMVNFYRQLNGEAIIDDMPIIIKPPKPIGVTSVTLTNATTLTIVTDGTGAGVSGQAYARVSTPLPGEARKARLNDIRTLDPTIPDNIVTQVAGTYTHALTITSGSYSIGDRVGVGITPLSGAYVPGDLFLETNIAVSAP